MTTRTTTSFGPRTRPSHSTTAKSTATIAPSKSRVRWAHVRRRCGGRRQPGLTRSSQVVAHAACWLAGGMHPCRKGNLALEQVAPPPPASHGRRQRRLGPVGSPRLRSARAPASSCRITHGTATGTVALGGGRHVARMAAPSMTVPPSHRCRCWHCRTIPSMPSKRSSTRYNGLRRAHTVLAANAHTPRRAQHPVHLVCVCVHAHTVHAIAGAWSDAGT